MSAWRRKAIETFPDLRPDFEEPDTTIYTIFFELLPRVKEAHRRKDTEELRRIYDFARWCYRQKAKDLWNAAAVAFYEHLVDEPVTRNRIPEWLEPDLFAECKSLFEARMTPEQFRKLCDNYARHHKAERT